MTDSPRRRRLLGRRGLQVIRHVEPDEVLRAMTEPPTDTLPRVDVSRETSAPEPVGPFVAGGQVPAFTATQEELDRLAAVAEELAPPPPLSRERILKLEAATAQWVREVQEAGPDATMVAPFRSLPPVPAARAVAVPVEAVTVEWSAGPDDGQPVLSPRRVSEWASRHDPRSLGFAVRDRLGPAVPIRDVLLPHGPILDQGTTPPLSPRDAAACTAMAAAAAANVLPRGTIALDESDALGLYHRAQELDHLPGEDYVGTSVLAVMKAGQEAGWWDSYLWALKGTRDVAQALLQLRAPVVVGLGWSEGCEDPDAAGVIRPTGRSVFGHALCVVGLQRAVTGAPPGPYFVLQQSRGKAEGIGGLVYLHHSDLGQMLAGVGEAAVPLLGR